MEKSKVQLLNEKQTSIAEQLAEFAVLKLLEVLQSGTITSRLPLDEQFLAAIIAQPLANTTKPALLSSTLGSRAFKTQEGTVWTLREFFQQPRLVTLTGQHHEEHNDRLQAVDTQPKQSAQPQQRHTMLPPENP